jgi:RND family efflux transporter MFP subunit
MPEALARPARKSRRRLGWLLAALVVVAGLGLYLAISRPWSPRPVAVAMETIARGPVSQVLAVNGRVAARRSVILRSTVQARLVSVSADIGDAVITGQIIAELDDVQPKAQVAQAEAALEAGMVRRDQASTSLERARALKDNVTRATLADAEAELAAAENEVSRLQALVDQARSQLDQYVFRAPFDGVILSRAAEQGQIVDAQSELFTIADLRELVVETDVDELYSSQIRTGLAALLKPAGGTAALSGTVTFAAPTVDPETGGRAIKIGFDNPVSLPIGLTVNANIVVAENPDALSIPRAALRTEGTRAYVLVDAGGVATARDVSFVDWPAERLEITAGLEAGERVILEPDRVKLGQAVSAAGG